MDAKNIVLFQGDCKFFHEKMIGITHPCSFVRIFEQIRVPILENSATFWAGGRRVHVADYLKEAL